LKEEKMYVPSGLKTVDKNIMHEFVEKIRNIEGSEEIMTNASRIINREIRKERKAGLEQGIQQGLRQGIALVAKKLKGKMEIKDISQITGLSEAEIENL
jgi:predicted transposase/invertase (TIGR01784 family)